MSTRTKKILALVTSEDQHLLDLPKYETTKGTSVEEQTIALINSKFYLNVHEDKIQADTSSGHNVQESNKIKSIEIDNEEGKFCEQDLRKHELSFAERKKQIINQNKRLNNELNDNQKNNENLQKNVEENIEAQIKKQQERNKQKIFLEKLSEDQDFKFQDEENTFYDELLQSSGSEYVPDTSNGESSDESDKESAEIPVTPTVYYKFNRDVTKNSLMNFASTSKNNSEAYNEGKICDKLSPVGNTDRIIATFGKFVHTSSPKIEQFANTRPWTKKSSCPYCFQEVTHFPRHLQRKHEDEGAVKELLSMSIKDPKRKELLNAIRRQGNFTSSSRTNMIRPVRRPKSRQNYNNNLGYNEENLNDLKETYIVCQDCLGYFKRNYLRRHRKHCTLRPKLNELDHREQHLSIAQLFTVCSGSQNDFYLTLRLKKEVFPIMRNDAISKIAMSDILICCYAESLLRRHKRKQIKNVISNKMRELGRFLLILKEVTGLQRLFDVMKPQFFENCIAATKIISGYNEESRSFKASSLALHMGSTLKQVCDIATKMIIQKSPLFPCPKPEQALKDIKHLKHLVVNHWNSEISSLALKNLNEKRYENPKLLPLTQDIMQFQQFVNNESKEACKALEENRQIKTNYRRLSECILALTLLLNRKRIGEIQYLKSKTYYKTVPQNLQEEFLQVLSETERTLTKKFKRVVTDGKGSKPVAILFPTDVQEYIAVLFSVRNLCVSDTNEYLFANPNTRNGCLNGYHTLRKLAEESGVNNKSLFTSTRLRKQIATVLQVINISEGEMEQFANFMGHTRKTHESFYRLPQDVYQTAKVSKLLMAINSGKGSLYKGKSLDEISLSDAETDDSDSEENETQINQGNQMSDENHTENASTDLETQMPTHKSNENSKNRDENLKKKEIVRIRWTEEQKKIIKNHFEEHIKKKKAPKKHEVEMLMNQHKQKFIDKNWVKIKAFVYNCYK